MKTALLSLFVSFAFTVTKSQNPCLSSSAMPSGNSCVNNNTLAGPEAWFSFVPDSSTIEITVTNFPSLAPGHIHNIALFEGICPLSLYPIRGDEVGAQTDSILQIKVVDLIPGIPYYINLLRGQVTCPGCIGGNAIYNICVQNLPKPLITEANGIISLDGNPSHVKNEIIIRINKLYLKMNAINDLSKQDAVIPVFVQPGMIQKMANQIFNGNTIGLGQLHLRRVFPNLTSADSISVSRQGFNVRIPDFWETFILTIHDTMSVFKTSRGLCRINGVRYADPNYVCVISSTPNDNFYANNQAGLHPTLPYPNANINAEGAWDIETGKSFVRIGVFDTGIDQTHSELNNGKVAGGFNFYSNSALGSTSNDNQGHGTKCAGVIGADRNNSIGVAGIAGGDAAMSNPGCSIYDMKIASTIIVPLSNASNAITSGAISTGNGGYGLHVMSNSYAATANFWGNVPGGYALHDAVRFADQNGVIFSAARGNDGTTTPGYPACFQDEMVINIGANGTDGEYKDAGNGTPNYSASYGVNLDVIAPGCEELVYTTLVAINSYTPFSGTSASTPHIAGTAGLMLSHVDQPFPTLSNLTIEDVENIMQQSAVDKNTPGYDDKTGWGLLNATGAINKIKKPAYKIQHFGVGQNATSSVSTSSDGAGLLLFLPNNFQSLAAGYYYADRYAVTITLNYNLSSPTDQIISYWPRFSSTLGWAKASPVPTDNWCQILSATSTQAVLRTYIYNFYADASGHLITDPWLPTQFGAKAALSIYTFDPTLSGVSNINNENTTLSTYPNPANNGTTVNVTLSASQNVSLEFFDVAGQLVKTIMKGKLATGVHSYELPLTDVAEGTYFIRLLTEEKICSKKLVVIK